MSFIHHRRLIICGKAASGKDLMRKRALERGFSGAVSYTTRPPRPGEIDGIDYNFLTDERFNQLPSEFWYEKVPFNGWWYATSNEHFYSKDIFIMTPGGIRQLSEQDRKESLIIFIDIDRETRLLRLQQRVMPGDSVQRRLDADDLDFDGFTNYDVRITNSDF